MYKHAFGFYGHVPFPSSFGSKARALAAAKVRARRKVLTKQEPVRIRMAAPPRSETAMSAALKKARLKREAAVRVRGAGVLS